MCSSSRFTPWPSHLQCSMITTMSSYAVQDVHEWDVFQDSIHFLQQSPDLYLKNYTSHTLCISCDNLLSRADYWSKQLPLRP